MESARLLNAIIENAIDGIITIDDKGIIEDINPAALMLFGYEKSELIGLNVKTLMPEPDRSSHDRYIANYDRTGDRKIIGKGREVQGMRKDGSLFPFRLGVSEVKLPNRKIYTGFVHDLSKEKADEDKIRSYTDSLEEKIKERTRDLIKLVAELEEAKANMSELFEKEKELNQLKTRFVSMASHEFRTPLSSIQLSASLINRYMQKEDRENVFKHTSRIKNAVSNLTSILNDFLNLEKLEAGRIEVNQAQFNIIQFAEEIVEEMQLIAKQDQHIIYQHQGLHSQVFLDPILLKNCIINLISNAIKYSGENTIIEFSTVLDQNNLTLEIKDNGIGIPESDLQNLFEPFFRAHNTGDIPGTGLGLNIVKRYVNLMCGEVSCRSAQHQGTIFTLNFPV